MKRLVIFGYLIVACVLTALASEAVVTNQEAAGISVATFAGLTALVSLVGTQIAKLVPYIAGHTWCKILVSVGIGMIVSMASWGLRLADFMDGFEWWMALLTGVAGGLSACGFYDLVKAIGSLFKKEEG